MAKQLEDQSITQAYEDMLKRTSLGRTQLRIMKAGCWISALNYCLEGSPRGTNPLPYSVVLVLVSQLVYGVKVRFQPPESVMRRARSKSPNQSWGIPACDTPVDARTFQAVGRYGEYCDPTVTEKERNALLKEGLVTLVGANLPYLPVDPYRTNFVFRIRQMGCRTGGPVWRYTIPGGHTKRGSDVQFIPGMNKGRDGKGYQLLDVPFIRELLEETGLPIVVVQTTRPLVLANQVIWALSSGGLTRYLAYVAQTLLWEESLSVLRDADGEGGWNPYHLDQLLNGAEGYELFDSDKLRVTGPLEDPHDKTKHELLKYFLTPIAYIALRSHR